MMQTQSISQKQSCLGVIIPAYNEVSTIDKIIERVLAQTCVVEVIVVDDASTDGTHERLICWPLRESRVRVFRHSENKGKGAAVRTALLNLTAPIVIIQDADLEYDPSDYTVMLTQILARGAGVVYGSRFRNRSANKNPFYHTLGNRVLTAISNFASGLHLTDEATCYKMFRKEIIDQIHLVENGFGFCPEITAKIARLNPMICEVPISYHGRTKAEGKKIRFIDGLDAIRCILKYNFTDKGGRKRLKRRS